ncbi:MAG: hypothetical protein AUH86_16735 [Acidobacteria bacterium 13_1_40CM_4_58_4]|nr:MAG: hypothetical protein AUH86_16735 [Acidobacteria bacterium 13_1_40CM_4_58_4]
MPPDKPLGPLDPPFQGRDAQFVVFDPQHDFISNIDSQCFAKGNGNHDSPVFIDPRSGFLIHVTPVKI